MAFLRRKTTDNISIGIVYSIFQKCIKRSLVENTLYYGRLLYNDGATLYKFIKVVKYKVHFF